MTVTDDPPHRYKGALKRLGKADIPEADETHIREFLDAIDPEINTTNFTNDSGKRETKSYGTLAAYTQALKRVSELAERPLTEFKSAEEINKLFEGFRRGTHPNVKDDGYGKSTLGQWESAVTKFFEYHSHFGIDQTEIVIDANPETKVDDRDMYTREEIEALRNAVTNDRDRCMLELFLNTGQRIRAIQTLRLKDVDTDEGVYYLNTEDDGLKGADKNGRKRPLLGAKRPVYDWAKKHQGGPEDYLITPLPSANGGIHGEKLSQSTMRRSLRRLADRADVDKPPNPHNFRHYFVTTCKRDYGMDDATIKHLIGHGQGSRIMETTYQHLNDEDHIKAAETAAGLRKEKNESPLTPQACPTCGEPLDQGSKACPGCGTVFAPNAKAAEEQIQEGIKESYKQADPTDTETMEEIEAVEEALDENMEQIMQSDELMNQIADKVAERMA
ncbi:tyrosine-type recombinase/integrase, partial [Natronomonas sp.]|uniref:tyrosine-type recombinase/integrase n=1 Tax=Natronomonas sp. TaxID=2184060 RepID=UPI0039757660